MRGSRWGRFAALSALAIVLMVAALRSSPTEGAPTKRYTPDADAVVARVDPSMQRRGVVAARQYLDRARRDGDPRYLGRAQAALGDAWTADDVSDDIRLLRATIRQSLHDFAGARRDLDTLAARRPDDAQVALTRATVAAVTGDVDTARAECARVGVPLYASACAASVAWSADERASIEASLVASLRGARQLAPEVASWAWAAAGDLARLSGAPDAEARYHRALAAAPADPYALGALADLLLDQRRDADVVALLATHADQDALLLRLAIAERHLAAPDARAHAELLRGRLEAGLARGDRTHLREHARFALAIDEDARRALALARENWTLQKEPADAALVLEAAARSGARDGAREVLAWLAQHTADVAMLTPWMEALR